MLLHDHASSVTSGGATPVGVQSTSSRRDNGHDTGHRNHKGHNSARTQLHCGFSTCHSLPCASRPRSPRLRRRHLLLRCLFYEVGLDQHTRIRFCASLCPRGDRHGLHVQAPFVTKGAGVNNGHTTGHRNHKAGSSKAPPDGTRKALRGTESACASARLRLQPGQHLH